MDHTESLFIEFNPKIISYDSLLLEWSKIVKPKLGAATPKTTQYRITVWYLDENQHVTAEKIVSELCDSSRDVDREMEPFLLPATKFYQAEEYHDHFLTTNASRMNCFL